MFELGPGPVPGAFQRRFAYGSTVPVPVGVAAFGVSGAGTFVLSLDPGAKLSYAWVTEIISHYDGTEQRISWQASPAIRIEGSAFLLDVADQLARATLMRAAASGATFLVALPMEEVTAAGDIANGVVPVANSAVLDWALPGQRVIVLGRDGSSGQAVVQSVLATSITIDALPSGVPARGARLMPLVPVVLDMQQGFTRHAVNVQMWDIRARATAFGWCGRDSMGLGVDVLTADAGLVASSALTDANLVIWDRVNSIDGTAADTMASRADVIDLGGVPFALGGNTVAEWLRPIKLRSTKRVDFQWLKAVTRHLRGAQGAFVLPTHRSDLGFVSSPTFGQLLVTGDYASWFPSLAHRSLAITASSGPVQYVGVLNVVDNNDGTNTLTLTDNPFGPITHISFAELVRLETDEVEPTWDGMTMTCDLVAHVVQDTTSVSGDAVTTPWAGHGLDGNITFPFGVTTLTRDMFWETGQLQSGSILNTAGFVPHFRTALVGPAVGTAIVRNNGADASGATGGSGIPSGTGTLGGASGGGQSGINGAGAASGTFGFWPTTSHPGHGGAGGAGISAGGAGGGGPASLAPETSGSLDDVFAAMRMRLMTASTTPISGGAGGAAGGGNGTQSGGGGGGGAGNLVVAAGRIDNGARILFQARGGAGGVGGGTTCGGGGGGGGGDIAIVIGRLPFPPAANLDNSGGAGGASGGGAGSAGSPGEAGATPMLFIG